MTAVTLLTTTMRINARKLENCHKKYYTVLLLKLRVGHEFYKQHAKTTTTEVTDVLMCCNYIYWICQVLQFVHNHRKEELCLGHICQHSSHSPFLQIEAQETSCRHRKVIMFPF
ncbi:hypothetical protein JOB18_014315 [Solea senegalensis]|uniref:Uncharacterized protein n=1 Tax=Solea senegalensis TaxID=28829 RepID=A0AAV6Q6T7_SOLSE|nr:hypothetical protein JOB18_014315 [Solea senegalensis]